MLIRSKIRDYSVVFSDKLSFREDFFIIDRRVYNLHNDLFRNIMTEKIVFIDAFESNKSYSSCEKYITALIQAGLKRGNTVAAIGGGIVQDVAGFITSIIYRGVNWNFYPTTLLAQCDSCIGGKTSINLKGYKNLVGNFNPPEKIYINTKFLKTLEDEQIQSGIGEIIKISMIDKDQTISEQEITEAIKSNIVSQDLILKALDIKRKIIEIDEFDKGLRNVMNYGHTFGHAIESNTNYKVPHGIAVGIGISIANLLSEKKNSLDLDGKFKRIDKIYLNVNKKHVKNFLTVYNKDDYIKALSRDKKNLSNNAITCILPFSLGNIQKVNVDKSYLYREIDSLVEEIHVNSI